MKLLSFFFVCLPFLVKGQHTTQVKAVKKDSTNHWIYNSPEKGMQYNSIYNTTTSINGHTLLLDSKNNEHFNAVIWMRGSGSDDLWKLEAGNDIFTIGKEGSMGTMPFVSIDTNGNLLLGTSSNQANVKLQVSNGDIYIKDPGKGIILTSPNGNCWRLTVTDAGLPQFTKTSCSENKQTTNKYLPE